MAINVSSPMAPRVMVTTSGVLGNSKSSPLDRAIREHSDQGHPIVLADPEGPIAVVYQEAALKLMAALGQQRPAPAPLISMGD